MEKMVLVYVDLEGVPHFAGRLWTRTRKNKESATFEYDHSWLKNPIHFALDPLLTLDSGPFHTPADKVLFGALGDSAPDRWGRVLMRRFERQRAAAENQTPRTLQEIDYLLLVNDETRQGALRFKESDHGAFLNNSGLRIPPLLELPRLLSATEHVLDETDTDEDLKLLLAPGSSLGGARPKASVRDSDGELCIAKFPRKDDDMNIVLWEAVALTLAEKAGITVPKWRLEHIAGRDVLLLRRFDRDNGKRVPFLSAMSMISANDNESHSYMEIVDAIRQNGASPKRDMHELWRRIVFSILIANTDDHLRNYGFLCKGTEGWELSPAYDLNPVPIDIKPRILSTAITMDDGTGSLELAIEVAEYFELKPPEAKAIIAEVKEAVSGWQKVAVSLGLSSAAMTRMASAFMV